MAAVQGLARAVRAQRVIVQTSHGHTVFDIHSGEVNPGDEIEGALHDHGSAVLRNLTTGDQVEVYVEAIYASVTSALGLLERMRQ